MVKDILGWFISAWVIVTVFSAWLTHVIVCIKTASWGFLIAGALCAPVGVVHGMGVWAGAW